MYFAGSKYNGDIAMDYILLSMKLCIMYELPKEAVLVDNNIALEDVNLYYFEWLRIN